MLPAYMYVISKSKPASVDQETIGHETMHRNVPISWVTPPPKKKSEISDAKIASFINILILHLPYVNLIYLKNVNGIHESAPFPLQL